MSSPIALLMIFTGGFLLGCLAGWACGVKSSASAVEAKLELLRSVDRGQ